MKYWQSPSICFNALKIFYYIRMSQCFHYFNFSRQKIFLKNHRRTPFPNYFQCNLLFPLNRISDLKVHFFSVEYGLNVDNFLHELLSMNQFRFFLQFDSQDFLTIQNYYNLTKYFHGGHLIRRNSKKYCKYSLIHNNYQCIDNPFQL